MTTPAFRLTALGALALLYSAAPLHPAQAAEGLDNCDRMITDVTHISAPGKYCLASDVTSDIYSGGAITIDADDVTIDCNDHVIRDVATLSGRAAGIYAEGRENVTVRNCTIFGFQPGILINGGGGHRIENNLVHGSRAYGIRVLRVTNDDGDNNEVRGNRVLDIASFFGYALGIQGDANVIDNTVAGVTANYSWGIVNNGHGNEIRGNRVRVVGLGTAGADNSGISGNGDRMVISGNHVSGSGRLGIAGSNGLCSDNTSAGFQQNYYGCPQANDNL